MDGINCRFCCLLIRFVTLPSIGWSMLRIKFCLICQISGDLDVAETALIHIASRLRANLFEKEGQVMLPVLPYVPLSPDDHDTMPYESRDSKRHGRGLSYSGGYGGSNDLPSVDHYGSYAGVQVLFVTAPKSHLALMGPKIL